MRIAKRKRFTQIPNSTLRDSGIGAAARSILFYLLSFPDEWETNSVKIGHELDMGRDRVRKALSELEAAGYIVRSKFRDSKTGQWKHDQEVHDTPHGRDPEALSTGGASGHPQASTEDISAGQPRDWNPGPGFPGPGVPGPGGPGAITNTVHQEGEQLGGESHHARAREEGETLRAYLARLQQ